MGDVVNMLKDREVTGRHLERLEGEAGIEKVKCTHIFYKETAGRKPYEPLPCSFWG